MRAVSTSTGYFAFMIIERSTVLVNMGGVRPEVVARMVGHSSPLITLRRDVRRSFRLGPDYNFQAQGFEYISPIALSVNDRYGIEHPAQGLLWDAQPPGKITLRHVSVGERHTYCGFGFHA